MATLEHTLTGFHRPSTTDHKGHVGEWWEIPRYSTWDIGNQYACYSQSTLVSSQLNDPTSCLDHPVVPTLYNLDSPELASTINGTNIGSRVSFSQSVDPPLNASVLKEEEEEMGNAYRMPTLLNNPGLVEQYHKMAKISGPQVQYEFAKQLLLCGSLDLATRPEALHEDTSESRLVKEGIYWIHQLAQSSHSESCFLVARWYELGRYGYKISQRKAIKHYEKAAKQQHRAAQYHLGCLMQKLGKHRKSQKWLEKASKQGFALASYRLGMWYLSGKQRDFSLACSFLRESLFHKSEPVADAGYHLALALMGLPGFDRMRVSEPHLYLKRAWMLGHQRAGILLNEMCKN